MVAKCNKATNGLLNNVRTFKGNEWEPFLELLTWSRKQEDVGYVPMRVLNS